MKKSEMVAAWEMAQGFADLEGEDLSIFDGYGLPGFEPVYTTVRAVAALIRWQALGMFGGWISAEVDGIMTVGKKKFIIIG